MPRSVAPPPRSQQFAALLISILLLLLALASLGTSLADLYAMRGRAYLERWDHQKEPPRSEALADADGAFAIAKFLDPLNPSLHHDSARALEWHTFRRNPSGEAAQAQMLAALREFRRAARLRPMWPYTWSAIGRLKLRLDQLDEEFDTAVERAVRLGPWEPEVQLAMAEIRLLAGFRLSDQSLELTETALQRALQTQPRGVIPLAVQIGEADLIRSLIGDDERALGLLARELKKVERL